MTSSESQALVIGATVMLDPETVGYRPKVGVKVKALVRPSSDLRQGLAKTLHGMMVA